MAVPNDAPLAVFTGRICAEKGLNELVDAWSRVVQSRPDAHLMLVGEGPLRAELPLRLQSEELTENVVGWAFDDVEDFLRAADLFVLPSWEEGLSLALLEAMAAELPVVVSDIAANRVVVDDQRHGLLVPVRDVESLATAILRIPNDLAAAQFGASARQPCGRRFFARSLCGVAPRLVRAGLSVPAECTKAMKRRVLQIIPSLDRSGAEKQLVLLATGLPRDEFDVHAVLTRGVGRGGRPASGRRAGHGDRQIVASRSSALWRLTTHVRHLKPDLVQIVVCRQCVRAGRGPLGGVGKIVAANAASILCWGGAAGPLARPFDRSDRSQQ
ncbi:MAG: glycosyltransferase [Pirellulales bacterium]